MVSYIGFTEVFTVKKTGLKITALTAVACLSLSGCKASYFGLPGLFYEAVEATEDILEDSLYYEDDIEDVIAGVFNKHFSPSAVNALRGKK